ncbi:MAG: superoxide dismutase [Paludibacteraceae bacterium]|nr:superoxide dismutase [Paludibacteraceae bacterium]
MNPLFILPLLGYNFGDVAPMMSAATIETHYTKHAQAYFDNLNRLVPGTEWEGASGHTGKKSLDDIAREATTGPIAQNAGQAWNHVMFFEQFRPSSHAKQPSEELLFLIEQSFGSLDGMRAEFKQAATSLFGSGWVWLVMDTSGNTDSVSGEGRLLIRQFYNDDNPLRYGLKPILVADVWEHAYYLDYRNRRGDYIDNFWLAINWQVISKRCLQDF